MAKLWKVTNISNTKIVVNLRQCNNNTEPFDCLEHAVIITKLRFLGFDGTALAWFCSYLESREQIVEIKQNIKGITSSERPLIVKREVPQGSVSGRLPVFLNEIY